MLGFLPMKENVPAEEEWVIRTTTEDCTGTSRKIHY